MPTSILLFYKHDLHVFEILESWQLYLKETRWKNETNPHI